MKSVRLLPLLALLGACGNPSPMATNEGPASAEPTPLQTLIVDHTNYRSCEKADLAQMQKAGTLRVFFAHASVGYNILEGLRTLHDSDKSRYTLNVQSAGERPPAQTTPGTLYEYGRGNPGAAEKVKGFVKYVANGWYSPRVDIVLDKFCYIDQDANFDEYARVMSLLENAHKGTIVLFATIPICVQDDANNVKREAFNDKVRAYCKTNKKALLDIADIESYDLQGHPNHFASGGKQVRKMWSGFSTDGGHLNKSGSMAVAKGVYSMLLGVAQTR